MLKAQPSSPRGRMVVLECRGGSDKGADGHRRDTIPICNALIERGYHAEPVFYSDAEYGSLLEKLRTVNGIIMRVNPGKYAGVT